MTLDHVNEPPAKRPQSTVIKAAATIAGLVLVAAVGFVNSIVKEQMEDHEARIAKLEKPMCYFEVDGTNVLEKILTRQHQVLTRHEQNWLGYYQLETRKQAEAKARALLVAPKKTGFFGRKK